MTDEVKVVPAEKIPAEIIMQQLGYQVRPRSPRKVEAMRVVEPAARTAANGRVIADFDTFAASIRRVEEKHPRGATARLEEALRKVGAAGRVIR